MRADFGKYSYIREKSPIIEKENFPFILTAIVHLLYNMYNRNSRTIKFHNNKVINLARGYKAIVEVALSVFRNNSINDYGLKITRLESARGNSFSK